MSPIEASRIETSFTDAFNQANEDYIVTQRYASDDYSTQLQGTAIADGFVQSVEAQDMNMESDLNALFDEPQENDAEAFAGNENEEGEDKVDVASQTSLGEQITPRQVLTLPQLDPTSPGLPEDVAEDSAESKERETETEEEYAAQAEAQLHAEHDLSTKETSYPVQAEEQSIVVEDNTGGENEGFAPSTEIRQEPILSTFETPDPLSLVPVKPAQYYKSHGEGSHMDWEVGVGQGFSHGNDPMPESSMPESYMPMAPSIIVPAQGHPYHRPEVNIPAQYHREGFSNRDTSGPQSYGRPVPQAIQPSAYQQGQTYNDLGGLQSAKWQQISQMLSSCFPEPSQNHGFPTPKFKDAFPEGQQQRPRIPHNAHQMGHGQSGPNYRNHPNQISRNAHQVYAQSRQHYRHQPDLIPHNAYQMVYAPQGPMYPNQPSYYIPSLPVPPSHGGNHAPHWQGPRAQVPTSDSIQTHNPQLNNGYLGVPQLPTGVNSAPANMGYPPQIDMYDNGYTDNVFHTNPTTPLNYMNSPPLHPASLTSRLEVAQQQKFEEAREGPKGYNLSNRRPAVSNLSPRAARESMAVNRLLRGPSAAPAVFVEEPRKRKRSESSSSSEEPAFHKTKRPKNQRLVTIAGPSQHRYSSNVSSRTPSLAPNDDEETPFDPSKFYDPLDSAPEAWGTSTRRPNEPIFSYTIDGELEPGQKFSSEQILHYILHNPRTLFLWVQCVPAHSKLRYPVAGVSDRCRFEDCTDPNRTINKGHFRVAFDELSTKHEKQNPYQNAGYVHLFCLEKYLDFAGLCRTANVQPDTRFLREDRATPPPKNKKNTNRMSINRDHPEMEQVVRNYIAEWRSSDWSNPMEADWHSLTLNYALTACHLEKQNRSPKVNRQKRGSGNSIENHMNDLDVWWAYRQNNRDGRQGPRGSSKKTTKEPKPSKKKKKEKGKKIPSRLNRT